MKLVESVIVDKASCRFLQRGAFWSIKLKTNGHPVGNNLNIAVSTSYSKISNISYKIKKY